MRSRWVATVVLSATLVLSACSPAPEPAPVAGAHDYLATEFTLTPEANLAYFSSGVGDGGYPVYVGFDAEGNPTRVVVDFYLLHLAWPAT